MVKLKKKSWLVRNELDEHHDEADEDAEAMDGADRPHENLAIDDDAV